MRKRVLLATFVALVLLAAAIGAGMNAVFTVTNVRAEFSTCSEAGAEEAVRIRAALDGFVGKSTTFLDLDDVRAAVEENPCFRVESAEKIYPATVRVSVSELREEFACRTETGYAILDGEGKCLYEKEENVNRVSGENILLEGFGLEYSGGTAQGEYFENVLEVATAFRASLGEIRSNVVSITLVKVTSAARNYFFRIRMKEGVVIDLGNPAEKAGEKAAAAIGAYNALSDENRIFGFITVLDSPETGEVLRPDYSRDSRLEGSSAE